MADAPYTILVTGSREWSDYDLVYETLALEAPLAPRVVRVVHGAARGADLLAGRAAHALGFEVVEMPAHWANDGKRAGPRRNQAMLESYPPDLCLAFLRADLPCRGTRDMMERCLKACVRTLVVPAKAASVVVDIYG